ncbi:hypothetical protein NSU17_10320 [Ureibacillus sp. FSL K6-2830]|uniref:hypothetical protein n=1 Tax=Ureibacillus sp. FSL K6-2830 TaxID=2954610 RepID=UPI0030FCA578
MLLQLLTYLLEYIKYQDQMIRTLLTLLIGKNAFDKPTEKPVNKPYQKLQVDELPITSQWFKMGIGKGFFGVPSFCSLRPCWFEIKPLTCLSRAIAAAFPLVSLDHIPPKLSFHRFFDIIIYY